MTQPDIIQTILRVGIHTSSFAKFNNSTLRFYKEPKFLQEEGQIAISERGIPPMSTEDNQSLPPDH